MLDNHFYCSALDMFSSILLTDFEYRPTIKGRIAKESKTNISPVGVGGHIQYYGHPKSLSFGEANRCTHGVILTIEINV